WGYGPSPPLYTWLQIAMFKVTGPSVLGLALLKNILLLATYLLTYANGLLITGRHEGGLAAAISLLFIPQVVWESQRDLTHTILTSMFAVGALSCLVKVQQTNQTRWYTLLGVTAGMGLLSKYNFGLWLLGLFGAALSLRPFRQTLLDRRMLLSIAIALLLVLPYGRWTLSHPEVAFHTVTKLKIEGS